MIYWLILDRSHRFIKYEVHLIERGKFLLRCTFLMFLIKLLLLSPDAQMETIFLNQHLWEMHFNPDITVNSTREKLQLNARGSPFWIAWYKYCYLVYSYNANWRHNFLQTIASEKYASAPDAYWEWNNSNLYMNSVFESC